jgi:hypothetical protein
MSILSTVTTGKQIGPQIHTIAGNNGVGKTTWAASHPSTLILDLEKGSEHIDVARISSDKIKNLSSFREVLKELTETKHDFQNICIDSVEALEGLIADAVCAEGKVQSLEDFGGGYGKGYSRTREIMREIMIDLQGLKTKGITSILVAHTQVKTVTDPATNQSYDRVIMRCNDKMAAVVRDLSDNVFYATYKVFTTKENGKTKAFGDGQRVMYTQWRPGFDAKNRLELPLELPLSYDAFAEACQIKPDANIEDLLVDITSMSEKIDAALKANVAAQVEKFKTNPVKLKEIKNRLMKYVA